MNNSQNQDFADNLDDLKTPQHIFDDATEWNPPQDVIYWKARAMSLEIENARLKEMIHDILIPHQSREVDKEVLPDREVLHLSMEQIHVSDPVAFVPSCVADESQGALPKKNNKSRPKHNIQPANEDVQPCKNNKSYSKHNIQPVNEDVEPCKNNESYLKHNIQPANEDLQPCENNESHLKHNIQPVNEDVEPCKNNSKRTRGDTKEGAKLLYGPGAAGIRGMEVALNINYERHLENPETVYWPNIPFKF